MKPSGSIARVTITDVRESGTEAREDELAVEEPLEIRLVADGESGRQGHRVSVTMRSPGHDRELACGFLLAEGIVSASADVWRVARCDEADEESADNIIEVHLAPGVGFDPSGFRRNVYTSSSCGVCGRESIEALKALGGKPPEGDFAIDAGLIKSLPAVLHASQGVFSSTGGLHACGLFSASGDLDLIREDVGRHNAVDKVTGRLLLDDRLPASKYALLVSGRASFELVHKTMRAGITTLLAVGAPSSLAVETARAFGMTLVGFVRDRRFNVYSGADRIRGAG